MSPEDFILELCAKNREILRQNWKSYNGTEHHNTVFLEASGIPFEFLAFHVGTPNQQLLVPSKIDDACGDLSFGHVFFSTSLEDLKFYLDSDSMVYFADLRRIGEARAQKVYKSGVLFQDDLCRIVEEYKKGRELSAKVEEAVEDWMRKYTIPFNPERIAGYKTAGDYILIRGPILVTKYP
ncbi:hypothetical protein HY484_02040 [Candidatus Woesearchaeota archaeon]|nr:hypothetical protein [Candidatus Woesearchaeota archaeon]